MAVNRVKYDVKTRRFVQQPREALNAKLSVHIDEYNLLLLQRGEAFNLKEAEVSNILSGASGEGFVRLRIRSCIGQLWLNEDGSSFNCLLSFEGPQYADFKHLFESEGHFHSLFVGPYAEYKQVNTLEGGHLKFRFITLPDEGI